MPLKTNRHAANEVKIECGICSRTQNVDYKPMAPKAMVKCRGCQKTLRPKSRVAMATGRDQ